MINIGFARFDRLDRSSADCSVRVDESMLGGWVDFLRDRSLILVVQSVAVKHHVHESILGDSIGFRLQVILDAFVLFIQENGVHTIVMLYSMADIVD